MAALALIKPSIVPEQIYIFLSLSIKENILHFSTSSKLFLLLFSDDDGSPRKKQKLNFDDCRVVAELTVSEALVQITVAEDEIKQRINAFIALKREEINQNNLRDFIETGCDDDSCARLTSSVYRIKNSKSHLRIKRINNEIDAVHDVVDQSENFTGQEATNSDAAFTGVTERLENVEKFLHLNSSAIPKDIYQRLKLLEDQISYLKTISPEYSQFVGRKDSTLKRKVYTVSDLDRIIAAMESKTS